jgi:hypothetical protein
VAAVDAVDDARLARAVDARVHHQVARVSQRDHGRVIVALVLGECSVAER